MIKLKIFAVFFIMVFTFTQNIYAQPQINYQVNIEGTGWTNIVENGQIAGTTGQAKRLEALIINLKDGIQYSAHVQNLGWQNWQNSGGVAGTVGQNLRIEAVRIKLINSLENQFDIYYRSHVQNIGWLGWAKNGEPSGTTGAGLRMEALQIQIVSKDSNFNRGKISSFYQRVARAPVV